MTAILMQPAQSIVFYDKARLDMWMCVCTRVLSGKSLAHAPKRFGFHFFVKQTNIFDSQVWSSSYIA